MTQMTLMSSSKLPARQLATYRERKAVGDVHEKRVADELTRRGWTVAPCGLGNLPTEIAEAFTITNSPRRWEPDLVAARGPDVIYIDAKGSMAGHRGRRRFVDADCVRNQMILHALGTLPIYYVFDGFEVSTPHDVFERGKLTEHSAIGSGGAYYAINIEHCRHDFDQLFGAPAQHVSLRAVA